MDWSKIDSVAFEKLCFEYARREFSEFEWESTGRSWDGNKDGEFREEIRKLNRVVKGWYEAKYTNNSTNSIPKSHMDSTLVSGILDGEVVFILFITNGRITADFRRRAFAILRPHRIDVGFVDGEILENWLVQNPYIYYDFFQERICNRENVELISIEDAYIYEALFSSPNFISPVKTLTVSNEYFIYLGVKSTLSTPFSISLSTDSLEVADQRIHATNAGYSSILLRCIAKAEVKNTSFRVSLLKEKSNLELCYTYIRGISIRQTTIPAIVYFSQDKVLHEMYEYIRFSTKHNKLLMLESPGGMGKSYLIKNLIPEIATDNSMHIICCFSEKTADNACLLCKLILFLSFGTLYELDESAFIEFASKYVTVPISLLISLRNGARNQIVALSAIKTYHDYVMQHREISVYISSPSEHLFTSPSFVILEDCHKLSERYAQLLSYIIAESSTTKCSQVLLMSCRINEGTAKYYKDIKSSSYCMTWQLSGLTMDDVCETMQLHFGERIKQIASALPLPVSILHLSAIVKELQDSKICSVARNLLPQRLASIYKRVNSLHNGYVIERMKNSAHKNIISLVYIVETGIPLDLLKEYQNDFELLAISELLENRLIRIENNLLKPYHDTYLLAFNMSSIRGSHSSAVADFLKFCSNSHQNTEVIEVVLTAEILSHRGASLRECEIIYDRCVSFYNEANYEAASVVSERILNSNRMQEYFGYERLCYIRYIYAQSVKATRSHRISNEAFKMLEKGLQYENCSPKQLGILYDCLSEIVNNDLWMLEFSELEAYLKRLQYLNPSKDSPTNLINAYLNFHNRSMMYYSFINMNNLVIKYYRSSINESIRFCRPDYLAYAKMDYAKTIYISNPQNALSLLNEAYSIFSSSDAYRRRRLDCESELAFLHSILFNSPKDSLYRLTKEMLSHHYTHSYFKTYLKILYLEYIEYRDIDMVSAKLDTLLTKFPEICDETRQLLYVCQLRYMLRFFSNSKTKESNEELDLYKSLLKRLGSDYSFAYNHNKALFQENITSIVWLHSADSQMNTSNCFILDPRIW